MMIYKNNRRFTRQTFEMRGSSRNVVRKGLFDEIEYDIPYDTIHNKKVIQTTINNNQMLMGVFFCVFSFLFLLGSVEALTVIFFVTGAIFTVAAFVNRKKTITIDTYSNQQIVLYFNNRNRKAVVDFSNKSMDASNEYLLRKYTRIDPALPIDPQIEQLLFLRNWEIISESHFDALKDELPGRGGKSSIGFGQ